MYMTRQMHEWVNNPAAIQKSLDFFNSIKDKPGLEELNIPRMIKWLNHLLLPKEVHEKMMEKWLQKEKRALKREEFKNKILKKLKQPIYNRHADPRRPGINGYLIRTLT